MIKKHITNMEVKKRNRNQIYRYMRKYGILSNPDIAYGLKLSLPTVTQNTKELIEMGLVKEIGELESTGGRKAKALSIISSFKTAIGLDITRHHVGMLLTNLTGEILKYDRIYFPFSKNQDYFRDLNDYLEQFLEDASVERTSILGIGISIPGIVDLEQKEISDSHVLGIQELLFHEIEQHFSYPCIFLNDANAGAFAEGLHENKNFFYLSLSNTVGGSFFYDGTLIYGKEFRCGEIGHMTIVPDGDLCYCGKSGCMDPYCNAKTLSSLADGKLEDFFDGLQQGREDFSKAWEQYTNYLSIAIHNIHMLLDCDIILGGYVGSYIKNYIQQIKEKVTQRNTFSQDASYIKECHYTIGAAAFGAALYVIEEFVDQI